MMHLRGCRMARSRLESKSGNACFAPAPTLAPCKGDCIYLAMRDAMPTDEGRATGRVAHKIRYVVLHSAIGGAAC